jgi:drug/metabolite transporter (DMT)-like permease
MYVLREQVAQRDIRAGPYYHSAINRQTSGTPMSDKTLRLMIALAIAMLLIFQIGTLISGVFGLVWGTVSAVVVAAVSVLSARLARAGGKGSLWFLLPMIIFTLIPIALMIWRGMTEEANWLDLLIRLTPFVVGFGAPIVLLLLTYYSLRKRDLGG